VRVSEVAVAGLGVVTIGFGAWQGLAARSAASEYRSAIIQLDAHDAKERSETHARRANTLFALGAASVVLGGTSIALDFSGVYDRWSGRGAHMSTVTILPTSHGIVGSWSVVIP
ncbi:MAG: hypothetical protein Q8R16_00930, partial [bacterium]|nr:hypothetical protein [bacterium]